MSLDQIAQTLLDRSLDIHSRALSLYSFQMALFYPAAFKGLVQAKHPSKYKVLRHARLVVAIKRLEQILKGLHGNSPEQLKLQDIAADTEYATVYNETIATAGHLGAFLDLPSGASMKRRLAQQKKHAYDVANIIDFSYRHTKQHVNAPKKATLDIAKSIVSDAPYYKSSIKGSAQKTRWSSFGQASIFLYLILIQKQKFFPPDVTSVDFFDSLIEQTQDIEALEFFFASYQEVHRTLPGKGYLNLPHLTLSIKNINHLPLDPLPVELLK